MIVSSRSISKFQSKPTSFSIHDEGNWVSVSMVVNDTVVGWITSLWSNDRTYVTIDRSVAPTGLGSMMYTALISYVGTLEAGVRPSSPDCVSESASSLWKKIMDSDMSRDQVEECFMMGREIIIPSNFVFYDRDSDVAFETDNSERIAYDLEGESLFNAVYWKKQLDAANTAWNEA